METEVRVEGNGEGKIGEARLGKISSSLSSPHCISNPVVYKLVRVEGDGRLVPATDDQVMEVEVLLAEHKSEMHIDPNNGQRFGCTLKERYSCGLSQIQKTNVDAGELSTRVEAHCPFQHHRLLGIDEKLQSEIPLRENVCSLSPSLMESNIDQSWSVVECPNPLDKQIEDGPSTSATVASSKPDFSKLQGEICLDSLSIKKLHETFKATFGRETTVKDKQWLKRRIAMGLTNSCDVSTLSFVIKDNKLVRNISEGSCSNVGGTDAEDAPIRAINDEQKNLPAAHGGEFGEHQVASDNSLRSHKAAGHCASDDHLIDQRAAKRVRKPTRRYIEEFSQVEAVPKISGGRLMTSVKSSRLGLMSQKSGAMSAGSASSDGGMVVTRLDSLGGTGILVPRVSRIRRSRPRKNFTAFLLVGVLEREKQLSTMGTAEVRHNMELKHVDSSKYPDENIVTVPTPKGGIRRKHHRAWTLSEVVKLVEGVSRYGAGRWSEIRRLAFASYSYRTSVDLKDKWRNLLKASLVQTPPDKGIPRRSTASMPIPAPILLRVRELAQMQSQVPPNLTSSNVACSTEKSVNERQPGYL